MPFEQWEAVGYTLQTISGSVSWWIGDWLNYGERKYGETYAQAIEATGWAIQRLKDAKWVAAAVPKEIRRGELSWTHHRHIAHLPEEEQQKWIADAIKQEWSSADLRYAIKQAGLVAEDDDVESPVLENHQLINANSGLVEYYTPPEIMETVRAVLGFIDLDPASCAAANETVKARRYYTLEDDGLTKDWECETLFMNPPYGLRDGHSQQWLWTARMRAAWEAGLIKRGAIALVNASVGTTWFQPLFDGTICFPGYRINFFNQEKGIMTQPAQYNALVYLGLDVDLFAKEFGKHGSVVRRYP